jgi:ectoine hydroxylase-related dioxygenase (phytanoyl-CoA dioxygenase family)
MNELEQGFRLESQFISQATVNTLIDEITKSNELKSPHGIRNAEKKFDCIAKLANSEKVIAQAKSILGEEPQLVRAIFFDKNPKKNWLVSWHQDKTVSVNKKLHIDGWGPWSLKDNTHHVQPSESVLNNMVTFRIHLDDSNADNGCLKVIPNSHTSGVLTQLEIDSLVKSAIFVECEANAGDMLIMRPLILHASSKAKLPKHRRVIHLEFSGYDLPNDVYWS